MIRPPFRAFPWILLSVGCGLDIQPDLELDRDEEVLAAESELVDDGLRSVGGLVTLPLLGLTRQHKLLAEAVATQRLLTSRFSPEGCATVALRGNSARFQLDRCGGPWGLGKATGAMVVEFFPGRGPDGLRVRVASEPGFELGNAAMTFESTFDTSQTSEGVDIHWVGDHSGQTRRGDPFEIRTDLSVQLAEDCVTVSGRVNSTVAARSFTLRYQDVQRCGARGTCPTGSITVRSEPDRRPKITLFFDGTNEAEVVGRRGSKGTLPLLCHPDQAQ